MKYFLDTEFIEDGRTIDLIDLISIGLVCEDGREYYAINRSCAFHKADKWVKENVLKPIGLDNGLLGTIQPYMDGTMAERERLYEENEKYLINKATIKEQVLEFVDYGNSIGFDPEFWADYCSYDWVVFCQLFGTMMDLPKGFPMYCNDIQQLWKSQGCPELPKQLNGVHNALEDARYAKELYEFLNPSPSLNYPKNTPEKIQPNVEKDSPLSYVGEEFSTNK